MLGRRQGAEVSIDGAVTKSPWCPTTIYRPRGKKLGAPWLLVAPPQSPDRGRTSGAPPKKARLPWAMESPRRGASLLHDVNNQISQDREPRTDSWSVISIFTCGPRRLPGDRWGTQQAQGPALSLTHPRAQRGKRPAHRMCHQAGGKSPVENEVAISFPPQGPSTRESGETKAIP